MGEYGELFQNPLSNVGGGGEEAGVREEATTCNDLEFFVGIIQILTQFMLQKLGELAQR